MLALETFVGSVVQTRRFASYQVRTTVGLWRSWERASMASRRSWVRIPSAPPKFLDRIFLPLDSILNSEVRHLTWLSIFRLGHADGRRRKQWDRYRMRGLRHLRRLFGFPRRGPDG